MKASTSNSSTLYQRHSSRPPDCKSSLLGHICILLYASAGALEPLRLLLSALPVFAGRALQCKKEKAKPQRCVRIQPAGQFNQQSMQLQQLPLNSAFSEAGRFDRNLYPCVVQVPPSPKKATGIHHQFVAAMSDSGLKGTTVYHNATPAELYEKVCKKHWTMLRLITCRHCHCSRFSCSTNAIIWGRPPTDDALHICGKLKLHNLAHHLQAMTFEPGTHLVASGALATLSGAKTGRSPKDKRVVRESGSESNIWWHKGSNGSPNFEMDEQ